MDKNIKPRNIHIERLLIWFTALLIWCIFWDFMLFLSPNKTTIWNYLYNLLYGSVYLIGAVVAINYSFIYKLRSNIGKMLLYFGLALLSMTLGLVVWVYFNLVLKFSVPFVLTEVFFMLFYPFMFTGYIYLLKIYSTFLTKKIIIQALIVTILIFIFVFDDGLHPQISSGHTFMDNFINFGYPLAEVMFAVLLSLGFISIRKGGGKIHLSMYIFSFGLLLQGIGTILFNYRSDTNVYWNGDISDLLYTISGYVLSVGLFTVIYSLNQISGKSPVIDTPVRPTIA